MTQASTVPGAQWISRLQARGGALRSVRLRFAPEPFRFAELATGKTAPSTLRGLFVNLTVLYRGNE